MYLLLGDERPWLFGISVEHILLLENFEFVAIALLIMYGGMGTLRGREDWLCIYELHVLLYNEYAL